MCLRAGVVELHSDTQRLDRSCGVPHDAQGVREIVVTEYTIRRKIDRSSELLDCPSRVTLRKEDQPEVIRRLGIIGLETESSATTLSRLIQFAHGSVGFTEVGVEGCGVWDQIDGLVDQSNGATRIAQLERRYAEEMESASVPGIALEDRLVSLGCLMQVSLLMKANGPRELVLHDLPLSGGSY